MLHSVVIPFLFDLKKFLTFSLLFMTLEFEGSIGQVFPTVAFNLGLTGVSLWLDQVTCFGRKTLKWCSPLLGASHWECVAQICSITGAVDLDPWSLGVGQGIPAVELMFFLLWLSAMWGDTWDYVHIIVISNTSTQWIQHPLFLPVSVFASVVMKW